MDTMIDVAADVRDFRMCDDCSMGMVPCAGGCGDAMCDRFTVCDSCGGTAMVPTS